MEHLFTTEQVYGTNTYQLKYSVVDMKEDNGRGDVTIKDIVLFSKSTEKIAAFEGGNGVWVLAHEYGNNTFRAYPVTSDGIGAPVLSSAGGVHHRSQCASLPSHTSRCIWRETGSRRRVSRGPAHLACGLPLRFREA